jgi:hypothetical protein
MTSCSRLLAAESFGPSGEEGTALIVADLKDMIWQAAHSFSNHNLCCFSSSQRKHLLPKVAVETVEVPPSWRWPPPGARKVYTQSYITNSVSIYTSVTNKTVTPTLRMNIQLERYVSEFSCVGVLYKPGEGKFIQIFHTRLADFFSARLQMNTDTSLGHGLFINDSVCH